MSEFDKYSAVVSLKFPEASEPRVAVATPSDRPAPPSSFEGQPPPPAAFVMVAWRRAREQAARLSTIAARQHLPIAPTGWLGPRGNFAPPGALPTLSSTLPSATRRCSRRPRASSTWTRVPHARICWHKER